MPSEVMLVIEHASGVVYRNQAGGVICLQPEVEGVLAPVEVLPGPTAELRGLDYDAGRGIEPTIADAIDRIMAGHLRTNHIRVDRARLKESMEAWVFVQLDIPRSEIDEPGPPYDGSAIGFGRVRGVLTWPNSD